MKKVIIFIICFFEIGMGLYAHEETGNTAYKIQLGLAFSGIQTSNDFMGALEFGFNLHNNPTTGYSIRNFIVFDIGSLTIGDTMNFYLGLSDKVLLGTTSKNDLFYYYFGMQWGIGFYSNENRKLFDLPIILNAGFTVGLDIYVKKNLSIFFEYNVASNIVEFNQTMFTDGGLFFTPKFIMGKRYLF